MRTLAFVSFFVVATVVGCTAPSELPAPGAGRPVVGHVRMRGRTLDLTVDTIDATGGDPELRRATARHEPEVWAGTDERYVDRDDAR